MSYSFNVRGATVEDVMTAAAARFDETVAAQPIHEKDREATETAVKAFAGMLGKVPEGQVITLSVSGSMWSDGEKTQAAAMSVSASFSPATPNGT